MAKGLAALLAVGGAHQQQAGRLQLGVGVGNHPLDGLEIADLLAELDPFGGVVGGVIHGRQADAEAEGADADPAAGQLGHGDAETVVELAHQGACRHPAVVEDQLVGGRGVLPHLVFFLADDQAGSAGLHQEAADPLALGRLLVGHGPDHEHAGIGGAGDEDLGAVEDLVVTVLDRRGCTCRTGRSRRRSR